MPVSAFIVAAPPSRSIEVTMIEARKAQEEADLKHAIAMSQAIEEQRLIAIREEQERQHAAAVAASLAEEQARKRAEQAVAEESAAAAAEQKAAAAAAARRAEEEAAVAAAAKAAAEQAERNAADAGQRASDAATVKRAAALPALAPLGAPGEANRPLLSLTRYHSPPCSLSRHRRCRPAQLVPCLYYNARLSDLTTCCCPFSD